MKSINTYLSENNAVYIIDREGNTVVGHNICKQFRSASVIKIFILAYYLEHSEAIDKIIEIKPTDTVEYSDITELEMKSASVRELLTFMIGSSDNTATNLLINFAGFDELNSFIKSRFCTDKTALNRLMMDFKAAKEGRENVTCLVDVKNCLDACLRYPLGRKVLATQKCRERIMRYIYKDVTFYGKAGEIPGVYNDVGYVDGCFAGVLTDGMKSGDAAVLCGIAGLTALGSEKPII